MDREIFRLDDISWRGLCIEILKNLWMILLAGISLWLGIAGVHTLIYQPEYTSSSTLVVTVKGQGNAYSSLSVASQMADVFGQVFQSQALEERIVEEVGEEIQGRITCTPIEETNLLVLRAASPDPRQAYLYMNSALKNYEEVAGDVFANASLQIVQEPDVPSGPSNTTWIMARRNLLVLGGMAAMGAGICLLYLLRFTVKTAGSASRLLDGTVRGVIPFETKGIFRRKKTKKALLLNSPLVSMDFAEASRRVESRIEYHMKNKNQKILLVTSISENEGKSTVAANIALALAEKHKKVLLVDGDLRKPAQHMIFEEDGKDRKSLDQIFTEQASWQEGIRRNVNGDIWELFQYRAVKNPDAVISQAPLTEAAEEWAKEMDYVIIDCSPVAVSSDAEIWMRIAECVVLVVREDWADVRTVNDAVDMIWQSDCDFAGFVLNAFHQEWFSGRDQYGYRYDGYGTKGEKIRWKTRE